MTTALPTASAYDCPYAGHGDDRKAVAQASGSLAAPAPGNPVVIGTFDLARQLLRSDGTRQAGFRADLLERFGQRAHAPVLFQEGEAHQRQRSATARFFAPKVVTTRYRDLMLTLADGLAARLQTQGRAALDNLSLEMAVGVAAEIVGLTDSLRPGMAERLNRFFTTSAARDVGGLAALLGFAAGQYRLLAFYLFDVRPAIAARRLAPREDVISHLIGEGYSNREILTECLTYGAAGMATTREFIVMAAWHLLERDDLKRRFLETDDAGRTAILEEVLRLEPVVGTLYRRAEQALNLDKASPAVAIAAGSRIAVDIRAANNDRVGACPHRLDPDRPGSGNGFASLSFGDGSHRCPGASVALQETMIFLERLLRLPGLRLERAPTVAWNDLTTGYELRGAVVSLSGGQADATVA